MNQVACIERFQTQSGTRSVPQEERVMQESVEYAFEGGVRSIEIEAPRPVAQVIRMNRTVEYLFEGGVQPIEIEVELEVAV